MTNYGMKVVKGGKDISSTDIRDLIFHSEYSMFKYHSETSTSMTINAGDSTKLVSFAHGLGYVPAFIGYMGDGSSIFQLPQRISTISGYDQHWYIYADSTNINIGWKSASPYNYWEDETVDKYDNHFGSRDYCMVGRYSDYSHDGAMRFGYVEIDQGATISSAVIDMPCGESIDGGSNLELKTYGIDEDNTDWFDDDPTSRTKTTAVNDQSQDIIPIGENWGITVTSMVQEIVNRAGWEYGNAMGFIYNDDGTTNGNFMDTYVDNPVLKITVSGSITYYFRVIVFKDKIS